MDLDPRDLFPVLRGQRLRPAAVRREDRRGGRAPNAFPARPTARRTVSICKRHLLRAALLAAVLFALYYANWTYGWITADDLDFYN